MRILLDGITYQDDGEGRVALVQFTVSEDREVEDFSFTIATKAVGNPSAEVETARASASRMARVLSAHLAGSARI